MKFITVTIEDLLMLRWIENPQHHDSRLKEIIKFHNQLSSPLLCF